MKIIAPYLKIINYVLFLALMALMIAPKDFEIFNASLICTAICAIFSLNAITLLYEEKNTKAVVIKSLTVFFFIAEIILGGIVLSSYQGAIFEDAPTWLVFSIILPPAFNMLLSGLIFDKADANNEKISEVEDNPYRDFSEKIRTNSKSGLPTHEVSTLLPITNSEDKIVMLKYVGPFQNVLRCKPDGSIVWKAELPTKPNDVYTNIEWKDNLLRAFSRSCIAVNLDIETGKIIPSNDVLKQNAA